jgi:hypothetical protein
VELRTFKCFASFAPSTFCFQIESIHCCMIGISTVRKKKLTFMNCKYEKWMMAKNTISGYPCRDKFPTAATSNSRRHWKPCSFQMLHVALSKYVQVMFDYMH